MTLSTLAQRAPVLLALFVVGCVEANAQTRPDAGRAGRDASARRSNGMWLDEPSRPLFFSIDGGIAPSVFRVIGGPSRDILAQAEGVGIATTDHPTPISGDGLGTIASPRSDGRFDAPENLAGVPLPEARSWLFVAGGWALRCLERAPEVDAFSLLVRFTVMRDGSVTGVSAQGASDAAQRCLAEGFTHARFRPKTEPVVLVARYRYTARGPRPRAARDGGVADAGRDR